MLVLPFEYARFMSEAGKRTLTGYLFMQVAGGVVAIVSMMCKGSIASMMRHRLLVYEARWEVSWEGWCRK